MSNPDLFWNLSKRELYFWTPIVFLIGILNLIGGVAIWIWDIPTPEPVWKYLMAGGICVLLPMMLRSRSRREGQLFFIGGDG